MPRVFDRGELSVLKGCDSGLWLTLGRWTLVACVFLLAVPEAQAEDFYVSKAEDTADGTCDSDCSLREAVLAANTNSNAGTDDVIHIPPGVYGLSIAGADEDVGATGDLDILEDVQLMGSTSGATVVDGNGIDRVFHVFDNIPVRLENLTVTGGITAGNGGGVLNRGYLNVHFSSIQGNQANWGGGMSIEWGGCTLGSSTVSGNTATLGGGLMSNALPVTLEFVTFAQNSPTELDTTGYTTITGTIFSGACTMNGFVNSGGGNLESPGNTCGLNVSAAVPDQVSVTPVALALGPLAFNGGPTQTHSIPLASAAYDTGGSACPAADQRGAARPLGSACDSGAFEFGTAIYWDGFESGGTNAW